MGKLLKIFASVIAAIILIIVIAAVALPLFLSPNDFKPQIETAVKDKTGRELNITGNLELSVFPWLGINTGKMILSNSPDFQEKAFAEIEESSIKVKLIPLLSKKIEVDRIVLDGLSLYLSKNKQGVTNWDDLKPAPEKTEAASPSPAGKGSPVASESPKDLAIAGITLKNASIDWNDQQAGKHILIKALNLDTDHLVFAKPVDVKLAFTLDHPEAKLTEFVKLATVVNINDKFDRFTFSNIDLSAQTESESLPGGVLNTQLNAEAAVNLKSQHLKISGLKIRSGDLNISAEISGTSVIDNPVFEGPISITPFNLAQLLNQWNISLPNMRDANALSRVSADFSLQASPTSADLENLVIKLDDSTVKGSTRVDNFSHPAITFNLAIDSLDLDRYLAPPQPEPSPKTIASPAAAVAAGASLFPVATLRDLNVNGLLSIDKVKVNNLSMQGFNVKLTAKNGVINTQQSVKNFYQGSYNGSLGLNVSNSQPVLALNEKLTNVQIEPLYKDFKGENSKLTGSVNASARLQGRGNSTQALKSSLNGQLNFAFTNGVVKGFNLQQIIDNAKSIIKGSPLVTDNPKDQTVFSEIKGSANVTNGLIVNKDLVANSSKLRVTGEGQADLKTEQLNYQVKARLIEAKATATEPEKLSRMPVIINVAGTFDKPAYTLDVANMLLEKNKEKIEQKKEELLEKLDKKLEKQLGPGGASDLLKRFF
ncbi:MAG: AsmA family protein [Gammaproteobacteria bacterium]